MDVNYMQKEQKELALRQTIAGFYTNVLNALKNGEAYPNTDGMADTVQKMYAEICSNGSSEIVKSFLRHDVSDFLLTMKEMKEL